MPSPFRTAAGESAFVAGQCPRPPSRAAGSRVTRLHRPNGLRPPGSNHPGGVRTAHAARVQGERHGDNRAWRGHVGTDADDRRLCVRGRASGPRGAKVRWTKTMPGRGWFVYVRIYGPEQPAFDGSWQLPDFEVA